MHHAPAGPPSTARVAAALRRWGLRVLAPLAVLGSLVHRSRVLPVTLAALVIASLAMVLPVVSSAEPHPGDVGLSSTAGGGIGDLLAPTPGGDWTTDGGSDATASRSARESAAAGTGTGAGAAGTSTPEETRSGEDAGVPEVTTQAPAPGSSASSSPPPSTASGSEPPPSSAASSPPSSAASSSPSSPASTPPSSAAATPASGGMEDQVLALVNAERSAAGCAPVTADAGLAAVARAHSADMRDRGFFDHVNPDGLDPFDRADRAGASNARAENIARGQANATAVMGSWMNSPGHRANILDCDLRTLGVGVATGSNGPWWTQLFGV